jgi:5-methylcytosine-specific restriction endonuclease McrA
MSSRRPLVGIQKYFLHFDWSFRIPILWISRKKEILMNEHIEVSETGRKSIRERLRELSDSRLLEATRKLAHHERYILTEVLQHLAEIQSRKLFSPKYRSLFEYARIELGYSEDQAARRIAAMRLLRELPELEKKITTGLLSLSVLGLAQTHFRNEKAFVAANPGNLAASDLSKASKLATLGLLEGKSARDATRILMDRSSCPEQLRGESVKPISSTMNELRIVVPDETLEKVSRVKGLLANKYPLLTLGQLLELMCDMSLERLAPEETDEASVSKLNEIVKRSPATSRVKQAVSKPRSSAATGSRAVGKRLRAAVKQRAGNTCELCGSTHRLEIDHRVPFARGGETSLKNLRLLCRNYNQRESLVAFGYRKIIN